MKIPRYMETHGTRRPARHVAAKNFRQRAQSTRSIRRQPMSEEDILNSPM